MDGIHDLGGKQGYGPIEVEEGEFLLKTEPDFLVLLTIEGHGGYHFANN